MPSATRNIFDLTDKFVDDYAALWPTVATAIGVPGHDAEWEDSDLAWLSRLRTLLRKTRQQLFDLSMDADPWRGLARRVMDEYLERELDRLEHDDYLRDLNSIESTFQGLRQVFDVMDRSTAEGWRNIASRLGSIERPVSGYRERLEEGRKKGLAVAKRQVEKAIEQGARYDAWFPTLLEGYTLGDPELRSRLEAGVENARRTYASLVSYLQDTYLPSAAPEDAVGKARYVREARRYLGMPLDAEEAYAWGWQEIQKLEAEMDTVAAQIDPEATVAELVERLNEKPTLAIDDFVKLMHDRQMKALSDLADVHFDIPPQIRTLDVKLAPPGGPVGAYYMPPSEDFSRPGCVYYAMGDRVREAIYDQISTAYHEGFPGHHLQCGIQVSLKDHLSRVHRLLYWCPGYGEGWALYTERLMQELGYYEKPEYVLGMLSQQLMRACRVVLDIGLHLKLPIPPEASFHSGEVWHYDLAVKFLEKRGLQPHDKAADEVVRYLGWPGQAICYKLGEREFLALREALKSKEGNAFKLKSFHTKVLHRGPVGLAMLRELATEAN